jgi:hypothetical protein
MELSGGDYFLLVRRRFLGSSCGGSLRRLDRYLPPSFGCHVRSPRLTTKRTELSQQCLCGRIQVGIPQFGDLRKVTAFPSQRAQKPPKR